MWGSLQLIIIIYEDFASFATRRFSTLTTIFGHLEGVGSHKNTRYEQACVYRKLSVYITRDFSSSLAIEMYGRPFFFRAIPTYRTL